MSSKNTQFGKDDWEARKITVRAARRLVDRLSEICDQADSEMAILGRDFTPINGSFSKHYAALESLISSLPKDRR